MGFSLEQVDPGGEPPRELRLTLTCDGDHGLFPPPVIAIAHRHGAPVGQVAASLGWRMDSERRVFCEEC